MPMYVFISYGQYAAVVRTVDVYFLGILTSTKVVESEGQMMNGPTCDKQMMNGPTCDKQMMNGPTCDKQMMNGPTCDKEI
jgi:hypothetical protein